MLDKNERLMLLDRLGTPVPGKRIVLDAVLTAPVRKVASRGGGNVISTYQSRKMQREIWTESRHLEFPAAVAHEHDPDVLEYYPQPCQLKFEVIDEQGEIHQLDHTPDFLLIKADGLVLEEWKSEQKLQGLASKKPWRYRCDATGNWHSPLIERWLAERGISYHICSDAQIPQRRIENTLFLEDYLHPSAESCPIEIAIRVQHALAEDAVLYLAELYEKAECRPDDVFKLIADGLLVADMDGASLSEPNRCRVFRDQAVRHFESARSAPAAIPLRGVLDIHVGARFTYNHQPYRVTLVGQQQVVLSAQDGAKVEISFNTLENLAAGGNLVMEVDGGAAGQPETLSGFTEHELRIALARQQAIESHSLPERTLRRLERRTAIARIAGTDALIALVPRTRDRGNRLPRLSQEQEDAIAQIIREQYLTNRAQNKKSCYKALLVLCIEKGISAPSYPTLVARTNALNRAQSDRARHGKRVAYQNAEFVLVLHTETPIHGVRPFQYVHLDHTELDIEVISSRTGRNLGRPWLSLAVDSYTRRILGFYLTFDPPSYRSNMMLLRDIVRRFQRLPQMIIVDNGKDFHSENFAMFAKLMGIHLRYRPAGHARHGAVLERLFGTLNTEYIHNLAGNTKATKVVRQTTGKFLPSRLAEWDLEALYYGIQHWAMDYYDQNEHSALDMSPREAFERGMALAGERPHRIVTLTQDFLLLTCPVASRTGTRKVDRQRGIKLHERFYYWCPEFSSPQVKDHHVPVRYDPWDASTVYVQINRRWVPAVCKTLAALGNMTETEREVLSEEYTTRHPRAAQDELSVQRLSEFLRTFTPDGALSLKLQRQEENRHLYQPLGMGAISPTRTQLTLEHLEPVIESRSQTSQFVPINQPSPAPLRSPSPMDDLSDFDTF